MRVTLVLFASLVLVAGCATAPVTGRQQLVLVSDEALAEHGRAAYQEILAEQGQSPDPALNAAAQRVGQRIVTRANVPRADWRFAVIDDPTPNAFTTRRICRRSCGHV